MAYGVLDTGFVPKTYSEIIAEEEAKAKELFGSDVDLTATSPLKKFIEITAVEKAILWQALEAVYYAGFIDTATGDNLDKVVSLVSITRNPAVKATGQVTFTGSNGAFIPAGSKVETSTGIQFETDADATISGSTVDVDVTAVVAGVEGNVAAGTITILSQPIVGVSSVTNASSMTGGADAESDVELRQRAKTALDVAGKGTVAAIEGAVRAVEGVSSVSSSENTSAHTLTLTVSGTFNSQDVQDAIDNTRPAGILVTFISPYLLDFYVDISVVKESNPPATIDDDIKNAIVTYITTERGVGKDIIYNGIIDAVMDVQGVADVSVLRFEPSSLGSYDVDSSTFTDGAVAYIAGVGHAFSYDEGTTTYTDETADINDSGVDDVTVPIGEVDDAFYYGADDQFWMVNVNVSTAATGTYTIVWEYWNGSGWTALTVTDGTSGYTASGQVTFDVPNDWAKTTVNGQSAYWIRSRVSAFTSGTDALLAQAWLWEGHTHKPLVAVVEAVPDDTLILDITYTNQDGVTGRTASVTINTTDDLGDEIAVTLQGSDTGVQDITNVVENGSSLATIGKVIFRSYVKGSKNSLLSPIDDAQSSTSKVTLL